MTVVEWAVVLGLGLVLAAISAWVQVRLADRRVLRAAERMVAARDLAKAILEPYNPFPHIRRGPVEVRDEIMTASFWNDRTREGFTMRMTTTDCYVVRYPRVWDDRYGRYVRRPVRVLDDHKLQAKMEQVFGGRMRELGWVP